MKLTEKKIKAGRSKNGGWSKKQVKLLGVEWPLKSGWIRDAIGKKVTKSDYKLFLSLKDNHLNNYP
jgi:hypothetical protein